MQTSIVCVRARAVQAAPGVSNIRLLVRWWAFVLIDGSSFGGRVILADGGLQSKQVFATIELAHDGAGEY